VAKIDAKLFEEKVGRPPINDDLHRANCNLAGSPGHYMCGWCNECDKPRYMCGCLLDALHRMRFIPAVPTRKVFYVDVGEIPTEEIEEYVQAVKKKCLKNKNES
jgi:hypothetical protein